MDLKKLDNIKINFIVGPGRSGTTLLVYVFNQNKNCITSPEIKHFMFFYKKYKNIKTITQQLLDDYKSYLKKYADNKKFFMSNIDKTLLDELKVGDIINYGQISKLLYLCFVEDKQNVNVINCIIDKNPYYSFHLNHIFKYFPDAKILFMIRDPRAYVLSNKQSQKPLTSILSIYYYAYVWNLFLSKGFDAKKKHGDHIKFIKYEDLAFEKEKTIKEIAHYFKLDYVPEMLNFHEKVQHTLKNKGLTSLQYERAVKRIKDLSAPINTSRVSAWENQLPEIDKEKIELICANYSEKAGYILSGKKISLTKKIFFFIVSIPARFRILIFRIFDTPQINHYLHFRHIRQK